MALLQTFSRGHPRPPPKMATAPAAAYATTPSRPASLSTAPSRQAIIGHPPTHPPGRALLLPRSPRCYLAMTSFCSCTM